MLNMDITLTRGDTYPFKFQRRDIEGNVITEAPASIYFTVKRNWKTEDVIFQKSAADMTLDPDGTWHCVIEPVDTEELKYGTYVYDIEVTTGTYVQTISKGSLEITEESTWKANK